jgi:hypothetical protein
MTSPESFTASPSVPSSSSHVTTEAAQPSTPKCPGTCPGATPGAAPSPAQAPANEVYILDPNMDTRTFLLREKAKQEAASKGPME